MFCQILLLTAAIPSIIECMRQVKGDDKTWKGYSVGKVRTLIAGKLEEKIEAGLIRWHEDEQVSRRSKNWIHDINVSSQTPEDWVRGMTTKDSAGVFPSCDPLFATLTAAVLERDIVIVQAEAELYASVS